jgi:hypothetical protein
MEDQEWTLIYSSSNPVQVEIIKGALGENEIECIIINKKDSVYLFGEVELYVRAEDALMAQHLISNDLT